MRRQKEIESAAQEWLADIPENVSEYEKIKYLYEQIVWRTEYQEGGADDQNIYSVLQMGSLSVQDMPRQCSIWQGRQEFLSLM